MTIGLVFARIFRTLIFAVLTAAVAAPASHAALMAGAGKADITPEWPVYLGGYFYLTNRHVGVHDPLNVRALVLDDGETRLVLAALDLIIMNAYMSEEIKDAIAAKFGIPKENVNISASHTHTGPEGYYEEFGKYPKEYDEKLKAFIEERAVEAVRQAIEGLRPASIGYEQFTLEKFNRNRHEGDGPVDRRAVLAVLRDEGGKPFTGFLNFAAHPTVVNAEQLLISAEWTGMFQGYMEEKLGPGSIFLYLQGACGNLSPEADDGTDGWDRALKFGRRLGDAVFPRIEALNGSSGVRLASARKNFVFKARTMKSVREFARAIPQRTLEIQNSDLPEAKKEERIKWLQNRMGIENFMQSILPTMDRVKKGRTRTLIQAMKIGDLLLLAYPGEAITELGMDLRETFNPRPVAVLGYSNDHLGYITDHKVYDEGGYEAGMGLVYPDSTDEMTAGLKELARQMMGEASQAN